MKLGFAIPYKITIRASANMGFIVKVGCGEFVAANPIELMKGLDDYLDDPKKWEEDYTKLPGRCSDVVASDEVPQPTAPETTTDARE